MANIVTNIEIESENGTPKRRRGRPKQIAKDAVTKNVPKEEISLQSEIKPTVDINQMIHKFDDKNPLSWVLFPQLMKRVELFCFNHRTDTKAEIILPALKAGFINGNKDVCVFGVIEGTNVIGHMLASKENYFGWTYVLIWQAETDKVLPNITEAIFKEIVDWTKKNKITEIRLVTARGTEGFEKRFGFEIVNTTMRKVIT